MRLIAVRDSSHVCLILGIPMCPLVINDWLLKHLSREIRYNMRIVWGLNTTPSQRKYISEASEMLQYSSLSCYLYFCFSLVQCLSYLLTA